jgi:UPF0716 protein FxsA
MRMIVAGGVVALVLLEAVATGLVASAIGVIPMLALGLLSTVAGMLLLRRQGWRTVLQMRAETAQGRLPAAALLEGAVLAVASLLLILPGFITDLAGILLFVPAVRRFLGRRIGDRIAIHAARRDRFRPARAGVIELDESEYALRPPAESPWRSNRT